MMRSTVFAVLAVFVLAAVPAAAANPEVIGRGIDPWTTVPEWTYVTFANDPLPAGFFCPSFQTFTGRLWLRGVPLASDNPALAKVDTIVERLDDAKFNRRGVARTRFQVRALQLEGIENYKNVCGEYKVRVTLNGEQPITEMRIVRNNTRGGRFLVPVRINAKVIFTSVDDESNQLEFTYPVYFPVNPHSKWTYRNLSPGAKRVSESMVDTDWDGTLDALVPGTSNFAPAINRFGKAVLHDHHGVQEY